MSAGKKKKNRGNRKVFLGKRNNKRKRGVKIDKTLVNKDRRQISKRGINRNKLI